MDENILLALYFVIMDEIKFNTKDDSLSFIKHEINSS